MCDSSSVFVSSSSSFFFFCIEIHLFRIFISLSIPPVSKRLQPELPLNIQMWSVCESVVFLLFILLLLFN